MAAIDQKSDILFECVKLRAYDKTQRRQHLLPGVTVMAPNDARIRFEYGRLWLPSFQKPRRPPRTL